MSHPATTAITAAMPTRRDLLLLALTVLLALALRLLVWHWREFYPLGGDEQEYLAQALTLLQERRYVELRLMRPPLYTLFLAGSIALVDSLVQHLRLVQAIISAATVVPVWLLTRSLLATYRPATNHRHHPPHAAPLLAALLTAASYTLAMRATELLTETIFLFGLSIVLWLLVGPARTRPWVAVLAGIGTALLCLTRSVGLVLLPLGGLWLAWCELAVHGWHLSRPARPALRRALLPALLFSIATVVTIAPWSIRNTLTYGGLILIDTTGAENLWLDNDPAGREAVKAHLYALGDDRLLRQQLATERGIAAITNHPDWFLAKVGRELRSVLALEYADDMRERQAIWVPPAEVWLRLLLGDALWLLLLVAGAAALLAPRPPTMPAATPDPRWLLGLLAAYVLLTTLLFHVELRYRLPLFPVLLPLAALLLTGVLRLHWRGGALVTVLLILLLLHRPYPLLAWQLGSKHLHLSRAAAALTNGNPAAALAAARTAQQYDESSALARVAQAQAHRAANDPAAAEAALREAIALLPAHPYAHLLLGDMLRQRGELAAARAELGYETAALQDLQAWAWHHFRSPPPTTLSIGDGLDLGFVQDFHAATPARQPPHRWSRGTARMRLRVPPNSTCLHLRLHSGRPDGSAVPVDLLLDGQPHARLEVAARWQDYTAPLPAGTAGEIQITLHSPTFTPRTFDPASPDGRTLGVQVAAISMQDMACP